MRKKNDPARLASVYEASLAHKVAEKVSAALAGEGRHGLVSVYVEDQKTWAGRHEYSSDPDSPSVFVDVDGQQAMQLVLYKSKHTVNEFVKFMLTPPPINHMVNEYRFSTVYGDWVADSRRNINLMFIDKIVAEVDRVLWIRRRMIQIKTARHNLKKRLAEKMLDIATEMGLAEICPGRVEVELSGRGCETMARYVFGPISVLREGGEARQDMSLEMMSDKKLSYVKITRFPDKLEMDGPSAVAVAAKVVAAGRKRLLGERLGVL